MSATRNRRSGGFSLIELVIVVVIIGIIGAIAIPRMSRGAAGASDSALTANLALLRNAIDLFQAEHQGKYPAMASFAESLDQFSNELGDTFSPTKDTVNKIVFGPYLRAVPSLPVGAKKGSTGVAAADGIGVGWIYDEANGAIRANCTDGEVDTKGVKFNTY